MKKERVILTLDAGGTHFVFSAVKNGEEIIQSIQFNSFGHDLKKSIETLYQGFRTVIEQINPLQAQAISMAFPGPCDYPNGIVWKQKNLRGYIGGIPLRYMLEKEFGIPVYMHNDAGLFAYGESQIGFLPKVNQLIKEAGHNKSYHSLLGVTLGTGLGSGFVHNGQLISGDTSSASEIWAMPNRLHPYSYAEATVSARGLINAYQQLAGFPKTEIKNPYEVALVAKGELEGDVNAALLAYKQYGQVLGYALAQALTLTDSLIVLGGGLSASYDLFIDEVMKELNIRIKDLKGNSLPKLHSYVYNIEDKQQRKAFLKMEAQQLNVPLSKEKLSYEDNRRIAIGKSVHLTSHSVAVGATLLANKYIDNEAVFFTSGL